MHLRNFVIGAILALLAIATTALPVLADGVWD